MAESHNWLELDKFSKARKSLIGYEVSSLTAFSEIIKQCVQLGTDTCKANPLNPQSGLTYAGNLGPYKTTMAKVTERPKTQ